MKPWCLKHGYTLIKGHCPYEALIDFKDELEEWSAGIDGKPSAYEMTELDAIYTDTLTRLGLAEVLWHNNEALNEQD